MAVTDLPTPGVTPPNWGPMLNEGIESRYEENKDRIDALEDEDTTLDGRLDALEAADIAMDERVDDLEATDVVLAEGLVDLDERLDVLEADAAQYRLAGVELAYASNETATATVMPVAAAASLAVPGVQIIVPATTCPVMLAWGGEVSVTVAGAGLLVLELWEQGGVAALSTAAEGVVAAHQPVYSGLVLTVEGKFRLEPSAVDRTYRVKALLYRDAGSSLAASVANTVASPTYIEAIGR